MAHLSKIEVLILMSIIIMLLFKIVHSKKSIPLMQALVVFAAVIVATYTITFSNTLETFENTSTSTSKQIQRDVAIRSNPLKKSSDKTTSEDATDPVFNSMVVYVSALEDNFQASNYKPINTNIAGDRGTLVIQNTTPLLNNGQVVNAQGTFSLTANINSDYNKQGIMMKGQTITGPQSANLGFGTNSGEHITGNLPYSIFWYAKNNGVDFTIPDSIDKSKSDPDMPSPNITLEDVNYFTLFGHGKNTSVASRCYLSTNISPGPNGSWKHPVVNKMSIKVQHSDQDGLTYENIILDDLMHDTSKFLFDKNYHLYTFVRDDTYIYLYVDDVKVASSKLIDNSVPMLTNKEFVMNDNGKWDGYLMMFGVYNKAVSVNDIHQLIKHIQDVVSETTDSYLYATEVLFKADADLYKSKSCPFNQTFCGTDCKEMTDWRYPQNLVLDDRNSSCLQKVVEYCNSGTNASSTFECGLWTTGTQNKLHDLIGTTTTKQSGGNSFNNNITIQNTNAAAKQMVQQLTGANVNTNNGLTDLLTKMMQKGDITDPTTKAQVARIIAQQTGSQDSVNINLNSQTSNDLNASFAALQSDVNSKTYSKLKTVGADIDTSPSLVSNIGNNSTLTDDQKYQQILSLYKSDMVKKQAGSSGGFLAWLQNLLGM